MSTINLLGKIRSLKELEALISEAVIYINASPEVNMRLTELAQTERKRLWLWLSLQSELQNHP